MSIHRDDYSRRASQSRRYSTANRLFRDTVVVVANENVINNAKKDDDEDEEKKTTDRKVSVERIKCISSDFCSIFAGIGFSLMVLENELIIHKFYAEVNIFHFN